MAQSVTPRGAGAELEERRFRMPAEGELLASKYRVERVIGSGGMGVVVAARHIHLGQLVAIKLLQASLEPRADAAARFAREAQAAASLRSDHVVRIYDYGTLDDGAPFMVMEYLVGQDLSKLLAAEGPQPVAVAVDYIVQACDAVAEAHARGIVHRDLKPSNLFVTDRTDGTTKLRVLDFGISKMLAPPGEDALTESLTAPKTTLGSPFYMSPEQIRDSRSVDARTDVWALGVILYELLAGTPPFRGDSLPAVCAAIAADAAVPIRALRPDCPESVAYAIDACLEKEPSARCASAAALRTALVESGAYFSAAGSSGRARLVVDPAAAETSGMATTQHAAPSPPPPAADKTLASAGVLPLAPDTGSNVRGVAVPAPGRSAGRRHLSVVALLGGAGFIAFALITSQLSRPEARSGPEPASGPAAIAAPVSPETFTLSIRSDPPGALVREAGHDLGKTPLDISVERHSVNPRPRAFELIKDGYDSRVISQGDSDHDVLRNEKLFPEPPPKVPDRAKKGATPLPAPKTKAPPAELKKEPAPDRSERDIRLER